MVLCIYECKYFCIQSVLGKQNSALGGHENGRFLPVSGKCPAVPGGAFSENWEKTAVPMSAAGRMLFVQNGLYTGILAFINA